MAFAAAFHPIMNDTPGFTNLGRSFLTVAVMTLGEFDFKETFLDEAVDKYETFNWLKLLLLVVFIVLMPIILMNLLLALAIDDTSSIMQHAKLRKHIQMAKIIIDLERKRFLLPWVPKSRIVPSLQERPNKRVYLPISIWESMFYGPDFTSAEDATTRDDVPTAHESLERKFASMMDAMNEMKDQMTVLQQGMGEIQKRISFQEGNLRLHIPRKEHGCAKEKRNKWTQFRGDSVSFEDSVSDECSVAARGKRNAWTQSRGTSAYKSRDSNAGVEDVFTEEQDVKDEKDREEKECDPELIELKELFKSTPMEEDVDGSCRDDEEGKGIALRLSKLFERIEEVNSEDESKDVV